MLAVEDVLSELAGEERNERGLPPGFRFHPTDEELITFYLASKVFHGGLCGIHITEVDLNRCEPWELPGKTFILFFHLTKRVFLKVKFNGFFCVCRNGEDGRERVVLL